MAQAARNLIQFEDARIRIHDADGERWITANAQAAALGYSDPRGFRKLVQDMEQRGELKEGRHFRFLPLNGQSTKVLSYRGVIRTAMRSDAPRAQRFREWAEDVLYEVMTRGSYCLDEERGSETVIYVLTFEGIALRIHEAKGRRWVAAKDVGRAIGHRSERGVAAITRELEAKGEFLQGRHFNVIPFRTRRGAQLTIALSYEGVFRIASGARSAQAARFRQWSEEALYPMMVHGDWSGIERTARPQITADSRYMTGSEDQDLTGQTVLMAARARLAEKLAEQPKNRMLQAAMAQLYGDDEALWDALVEEGWCGTRQTKTAQDADGAS